MVCDRQGVQGARGSLSTYVVLPGIGGSGPAHWQTLWEQADPRMQRFAHPPISPLRFPGVIVASSDDPYGPVDHASLRAGQWGCTFV
ncbi:alpha/beta hydrolase [Novosphingobium sp. BL-8H]|uniref:alpha/beta hydrolase n=1 Tax=Novosphingobium sp. BL-8H TaxID=3127640 RepID=UPI0037575A44